MLVHEDHRRKLIEFGHDTFKVCKVAIAKENCVLGDHHHRHKDEHFLLLSGVAGRVVIGDQTWTAVEAPFEWHVPRGSYHAFYLNAGSVLIGTATAEFDPADEIKGEP